MFVGRELLALARAGGATSIAVVGTAKNVGKTVTVGAIGAALDAEGMTFGLASSGRDGEAVDVIEATPKPRFHLRAGTILATVDALLPRSAATQMLEATGERGALGPIVIVRVLEEGFFEVAGPSTAAAMRRVVERLAARVPFVLIDGAIDRIASLRDGNEAIVVAVGAAFPTLEQVIEDLRRFLARLSAVRRERPLRPIACTVAPRGPEGAFAPAAFLAAVAAATGLPTYDVYAGEASCSSP